MTEKEAIDHINNVANKEIRNGLKEGYNPRPFHPFIFGIKDCPIEGYITFEELKQMLIRQL